MSATVCGKRSFFDDLQSSSPASPSSPISKKLRCSSTSPIRFSPPTMAVDQLRALFPDIDTQPGALKLLLCVEFGEGTDHKSLQYAALMCISARGSFHGLKLLPPGHVATTCQLLQVFRINRREGMELLEKALEECGNDLDAATKRLLELRLDHAEGKSFTSSEADGEMNDGIEITASVLNLPADGVEWVELLIREMMSATNTDDAKARVTRVLESLEKSISTGASAEAAQNIQKENMMLKEQIEMIFRDNAILKRAVAIQHERQKELNDKNQEVLQLKQLFAQYQEQLRTLEVNNYSLKMHLQQAQQCNSIPGHFHPDIF